jgi:hypothetical protein
MSSRFQLQKDGFLQTTGALLRLLLDLFRSHPHLRPTVTSVIEAALLRASTVGWRRGEDSQDRDAMPRDEVRYRYTDTQIHTYTYMHTYTHKKDFMYLGGRCSLVQ